jgi:CheY-like chemotaxis protein
VIENARVAAAPDGSHRREEGAVILAVEDNADVRTTVVRQLTELGYVVREADSAHAAWRILEEDDRIDLLFTDIVMPGAVNGIELATAAKERHPHLRILFTSGFTGGPPIDGELLERGDILLSKPYAKGELEEALGQILMQRIPVG